MFFPTNPSPSPHSAPGSAPGSVTKRALFGTELPAERGSATEMAFFGAE